MDLIELEQALQDYTIPLNEYEKTMAHLQHARHCINKNTGELFIIPIEEMSELTKHLTKIIRGKEKINNNNIALLEELVDVQICLDNLKIVFKLDESLIDKIMDIKMRRMMKGVDNEK